MYVITVLVFPQGPFNDIDHRLAVNGFSKVTSPHTLYHFQS